MTNVDILDWLKEAKSQKEVNYLRSKWVRQNKDDMMDILFEAWIPEGFH